MARRAALMTAAIAGVTSLAAERPAPTGVPRLRTAEALSGWALPLAGVRGAPRHHGLEVSA